MPSDKVALNRHRSPWVVLLKRLSGNKMGMLGVFIISVLVLVAIFAPLLEPYSFKAQDISNMNEAPSQSHLLGTDEFGRDLLSRILRGARISFVVGVMSVAISVVIGVVIGGIAGFYGGTIDLILTSIADLTWSMPAILIALLLVAIIGPGLESVVLVGHRVIRVPILRVSLHVLCEASVLHVLVTLVHLHFANPPRL